MCTFERSGGRMGADGVMRDSKGAEMKYSEPSGGGNIVERMGSRVYASQYKAEVNRYNAEQRRKDTVLTPAQNTAAAGGRTILGG